MGKLTDRAARAVGRAGMVMVTACSSLSQSQAAPKTGYFAINSRALDGTWD